MTRINPTKMEEAARWVQEIHQLTKGVWLTPAQVRRHYPGGKISKMTAVRAISAAMEGRFGANDTKTPETVH